MESTILKPSGRTKILEVLARFPAGLNTAKICQLVCKDYAISEQHLGSELTRLVREGKVKKEGKKECPSCSLRTVVYSLRKNS